MLKLFGALLTRLYGAAHIRWRDNGLWSCIHVELNFGRMDRCEHLGVVVAPRKHAIAVRIQRLYRLVLGGIGGRRRLDVLKPLLHNVSTFLILPLHRAGVRYQYSILFFDYHVHFACRFGSGWHHYAVDLVVWHLGTHLDQFERLLYFFRWTTLILLRLLLLLIMVIHGAHLIDAVAVLLTCVNPNVEGPLSLLEVAVVIAVVDCQVLFATRILLHAAACCCFWGKLVDNLYWKLKFG